MAQQSSEMHDDNEGIDSPWSWGHERTYLRDEQNFSPDFYDGLSHVSITPMALRELHRRTAGLEETSPRSHERPRDLTRFARRGGPDLGHLKNFLVASRERIERRLNTARAELARLQAAQSSSPNQTPEEEANPQLVMCVSSYDRNFEQHLKDHNIWVRQGRPRHLPPFRKPANIAEIEQRVRQDRMSIEPDEAYFHTFVTHHDDGAWEDDSMREILLPILTGSFDVTNESRYAFRGLRPVTGYGTITVAPDHYDGVARESVHRAVLAKLSDLIVPSDYPSAPVAPNFFLTTDAEAVEHPRRQATHHGAYGVQAMLALQNFGLEETDCDNCAYAFSVTYRRGQLTIYCHHPSEPVAPGERPIYTTTLIGGWYMLDDMENFQKGVRAFKNVRELAREYVERLVSEANARAEEMKV